jgi:hypothetical protein
MVDDLRRIAHDRALDDADRARRIRDRFGVYDDGCLSHELCPKLSAKPLPLQPESPQRCQERHRQRDQRRNYHFAHAREGSRPGVWQPTSPKTATYPQTHDR